MPLLIGIDEAGYGPNLGPLVVAATVWEVPEGLVNLWSLFDGIIAQAADRTGETIHIADSKCVHSSTAGLAPLERSAESILKMCDLTADRLVSLCKTLTGRDVQSGCAEPYFRDFDLVLPLEASAPQLLLAEWRNRCADRNVRLRSIACRILFAGDFNAALDRCGGKGRLLSETTFDLLRGVWQPDTPATIQCDKHGGRNQYGDLLANAFADHFPQCRHEGRSSSLYRIGEGDIELSIGAERHLPVAAASIVAKYIRELWMELFNRYWESVQPGIRRTKGYPTDARRFMTEAESHFAAAGILRENYWRKK